MNFDVNEIARILTDSISLVLAADRNLLHGDSSGRSPELDRPRSRRLPVLAGSGNRSIRHLAGRSRSLCNWHVYA